MFWRGARSRRTETSSGLSLATLILVLAAWMPACRAREDSVVAPGVSQTAASVTDRTRLALHGHVQRADGSTATNVRARLVHGLRAPAEELERGIGDRDDMQVPVAPDGTIEVRLDVPFGAPRVLELRADDAAARWVWLDAARSNQGLGTIELQLAGELEVAVVDETGDAEVRAHAVAGVGEFLEGPDGTVVFARSARATCDRGRALLRGLSPGEQEFEARSITGAVLARGRAHVAAGERGRVVLGPAPPLPRDRVFVEIELPIGVWIDSRSDAVELVANDGKRAVPQWVGGKTTDRHVQTCAFLHVPDAPHTLRIHDRRFLPWSMDDVRPGMRIRAKPRGPCTVALHFAARDDRALRAGLACRIELNHSASTGICETRTITTTERGCVLDGLLCGSWKITVDHPLHRPASLTVSDLVPGETRDVQLELEPGRILHGIVADDSEEGARVRPTLLVTALSPAELAAHRPGAPVVAARSLATKQGERFVIDRLPADASVLLVCAGPCYEGVFPLPSGDDGLSAEQPFVLHVPRLRSIVARIARTRELDSPSNKLDFSGYLAYAARVTEVGAATERVVIERSRAVSLGCDGTIVFEGVERGEYDLWIAPPMSEASDADLARPDAQTLVHAGRVRVGDEDTEPVVLELGERALGCVALQLNIPGLSDVHAAFCDLEGRTCSHGLVSSQGTDARVPLPPGTYSLSLFSLAPRWAITFDELVVVRPGERTALRQIVRLVRGRVRFEDEESGFVASGSRLALRTQTAPAIAGRETFPVVMGPSGEVELELPEGRFEVLDSAVPSDGRERIRGAFVWPPLGDLPLVVRLKP